MMTGKHYFYHKPYPVYLESHDFDAKSFNAATISYSFSAQGSFAHTDRNVFPQNF
jgi:hypothetical protein